MIIKDHETKLRQFVKKIVEDSIENIHHDSSYDENHYDRILEPQPGQTVYMENKHGKMVMITIINGQFWSNERVSNFWSWKCKNGDIDRGYGYFYIKKK